MRESCAQAGELAVQDVCARASAVVARREEQVGIGRAQKKSWRALKSPRYCAGCYCIHLGRLRDRPFGQKKF